MEHHIEHHIIKLIYLFRATVSVSRVSEPSPKTGPSGDGRTENLRTLEGADNISAMGSGDTAAEDTGGEYNPDCNAFNLDTAPASKVVCSSLAVRATYGFDPQPMCPISIWPYWSCGRLAEAGLCTMCERTTMAVAVCATSPRSLCPSEFLRWLFAAVHCDTMISFICLLTCSTPCIPA